MKISKSAVALFGCLALSVAAFTAHAQQPPKNSPTINEVLKRGTLRLGWTVNYPTSYRDPQTNTVGGYAVDLVQEMAKELGVKFEAIEDSAATLPAGLQAKKFDISIPLAITPPRLQVVSFSKPFLKSPVNLAVLSKNAQKWANWQAMDQSDLKVSTTLGSNIDLYVTNVFKKAEIQRVRNQTDSLAALLGGRVDAWANSSEALRRAVEERSDVVILPNSEFAAAELAIPLVKDDTAFVAWVDQFLARKKADGSLKVLMAKYQVPNELIN